MLLVKTKIGPSKISGTGLFADEFIPKGTITWRAILPFDLQVDREDIEKLSPPAKELFMKYSYLSKWSDKYVLCFDDARFLNHSDNPSVVCGPYMDDGQEPVDIAVHDIYPGEEMTCDYRSFDTDIEQHGFDFIELHSSESYVPL